MATRYLDDTPQSTAPDASGYSQLSAVLKRSRADGAVKANPVGPPSLLPAPALPMAPASEAGVRVNPTLTRLANEGALRPESGNFSASNPQPQVDAGGNVLPTPLTRPTAPAPVAVAANPAARAATAIASAAPTIATVTPATAANSATLVRPVVTDGASAAPGGATSISGRPLGYGSMENGVRVFSDGTGNGPAATITRPQIDALAQRNVVPSVVPAPGVAASMATGGQTPELGGALTRPAAAQGGVFHMPSATDMAASDIASIYNRDPRSALGRAARNADVEARTMDGGPGLRSDAQARALGGLVSQVADGQKASSEQDAVATREAGDTSRVALQQQGENARADLAARTDVTRAQLTRPTPSTINLEDGSLGIVGQDGVVRPALGADGKPARAAPTRRDVDQGAYAKMVTENVNRLLGIDPVSGMIADGGKGRAPTAAELEQATSAASSIADRAFGRAGAGGPGAAAKPTKDQFVAAARKANPNATDADLEKYYAANYGS